MPRQVVSTDHHRPEPHRERRRAAFERLIARLEQSVIFHEVMASRLEMRGRLDAAAAERELVIETAIALGGAWVGLEELTEGGVRVGPAAGRPGEGP
jgi:hypothetical protein